MKKYPTPPRPTSLVRSESSPYRCFCGSSMHKDGLFGLFGKFVCDAPDCRINKFEKNLLR